MSTQHDPWNSPVFRTVVGFGVIGASIVAVSALHALLGDPIDSIVGSTLSVLVVALVGMGLAFCLFRIYFQYSEA